MLRSLLLVGSATFVSAGVVGSDCGTGGAACDDSLECYNYVADGTLTATGALQSTDSATAMCGCPAGKTAPTSGASCADPNFSSFPVACGGVMAGTGDVLVNAGAYMCKLPGGTTASAGLTSGVVICAPGYVYMSGVCVAQGTGEALVGATIGAKGDLDGASAEAMSNPNGDYAASATVLDCAATKMMDTNKQCVAKPSTLIGIACKTPGSGTTNALATLTDAHAECVPAAGGAAVSGDTAGVVSCKTAKMATDADTCEDVGALGSTCYANGDYPTGLKAAGMQCLVDDSTKSGKTSCASGKVENASAACVDPAFQGTCDLAAMGTPSDTSASDANTWAAVDGYKCVGSGLLLCDIAGGYLPCGAVCKKTGCEAASVARGSGCGTAADCTATTDGDVTCQNAGSNMGTCSCPENALSGAQACATGTDKGMKIGNPAFPGTTFTTSYASDGSNGIICAEGYVQGKTSNECTKFTGTVGDDGQECKSEAQLDVALFTNFTCDADKVKCKSGTQCTDDKTECNDDATACKCATGKIQSNATDNPCIDLAIGASCENMTGKANLEQRDEDAHECTNNVIACKTGFEKCPSSNKCVMLAADPYLCEASTSTGGSGSSSADNAAGTTSVVLPLGAVLVAALALA